MPEELGNGARIYLSRKGMTPGEQEKRAVYCTCNNGGQVRAAGREKGSC